MIPKDIDIVAKIREINRRNKEKRIKEWTKCGPPHATAIVGDPGYTETYGYWHIGDRIVRIRQNKNGEYDPANRIEITHAEVMAIVFAKQCTSSFNNQSEQI